MADIVDVLRKIAAQRVKEGKPMAGPSGAAASQTEGPSPILDPVSRQPMEERDIFHNGQFLATLDYCKQTGAWFLDTDELNKLLDVTNIVSIIQAEENK